MKPSKDRGILGKPRLNFADNEQLRRYYEGKYREGGYEDGWVKRGVNISELYHARRRQVALGFLRSAPDEIVLDAGCGKGTLAGTVAPTCREIHAIDIATNALDEEHRSISNLHFQQMNVETLNFADEFFDKVVCIETLEHVLNPQRALSEFYRVLKKGGRLVLTYPTINRTVVKRFIPWAQAGSFRAYQRVELWDAASESHGCWIRPRGRGGYLV